MNTSSQPLVSIVTPVYNEAKYLGECIESILAQTYTNWEFTILDNCSSDGSAEIAHRFAANNPRIRVKRNERYLPIIENHNVALRQISPKCKYCKLVLADDWIFPQCIELMVGVGEKHASAGIIGAYVLEGAEVICTGLPYPSHLIPGREICRRHFLDNLYVFGSPNAVLYRADLVRSQDPFYNENNIHADTEACLALLRTSDFGFVHQVLSFTRVRQGSQVAIANNLHAYFAAMLHLILRFGPDYLTPTELKRHLKRHMSNYYGFLARNLVLSRNKCFWKYHREMLKEMRIEFSWTQLGKAFALNICRSLMNPLDTLEIPFRRGKSHNG